MIICIHYGIGIDTKVLMYILYKHLSGIIPTVRFIRLRFRSVISTDEILVIV